MTDVMVRSEPGFSPSLDGEIIAFANDNSTKPPRASSAVERAWVVNWEVLNAHPVLGNQACDLRSRLRINQSAEIRAPVA